MNERYGFQYGWKFKRELVSEATSIDYLEDNFNTWEDVSLPHSLRLEPLYHPETFTYQGIATYLKRFDISKEMCEKEIFLEFEAVMGVTEVWVNGVLIHTNYGGYLPFVISLSNHLYYGETNQITVITNNCDNGQVPPGKPQELLDFTYFGGIYRDVWLDVYEKQYITNPLYENIPAGGGVSISYPKVSDALAELNIKTHMRNIGTYGKEAVLKILLFHLDGGVVEEEEQRFYLEGESDKEIESVLEVKHPKLWNLKSPHLYCLVLELCIDNSVVHRHSEKIGIRKISIDRERGLYINGKRAPMLSGVNRHQDYPIIGNAAPSSMQRRDAILFQKAGFHVVRAAHYPMSIEFVKACDELGILLMEATPGWQWYPVGEDALFTERVHYNIRQMVRRDRNHPCILCYEVVLNETYHVPKNYTRRLEQTALEEHKEAKVAAESYGYNVEMNGKDELADFMFGSQDPLEKTEKAMLFDREYADFWMESYGNFGSRRVTRGENQSFYPGGEARNVLKARKMLWEKDGDIHTLNDRYEEYEKNPAFTGCAIWTGIDSRGMWSDISPCGILDSYRIPKYSYYAYESQKPLQEGCVLFIASSWGKKAPAMDKIQGEFLGSDELREIDVYSNCAMVQLTVWKEEKICYRKSLKATDYKSYLPHPPFLFSNVPYIYGSYLEAMGYDEYEKEIEQSRVYAQEHPTSICLESRALGIPLIGDGRDILPISAFMIDKNGTICTEIQEEIYVTIEGGRIVGDGDWRLGVNPAIPEAGISTIYIQAERGSEQIIVHAAWKDLKGHIRIPVQKETLQTFTHRELPKGDCLRDMSYNLMDKKITGEGEKDVAFLLKGKYTKVFADVLLHKAEKDTKLQIYLDGILREEKSEEVSRLHLQVMGCHRLELNIKGEGYFELENAYLIDDIYEEADPIHKDIALGKEAVASVNTQAANRPLMEGFAWETIWMGAPMESEEPQWWQIDFGEVCSIRNAKVYIGGQMGSDSTNYTYEIWTSLDGMNWITQCKVRRTSWSNGVLDRFCATDIRFLRVVFMEIDGGMSAAISKFEAYRDYGVDSSKEINLKGIIVEGAKEELVFSPNTTEYFLTIPDFDRLRVRAIPEDPLAVVQIEYENGEKVEISVTSTNGKGKKVYIIYDKK